jgi:stage V sporulation protein G
MKITDVKVFPVDEEKLKAYATITFENCFIVRDLKVISGNKGYFIAMPSKKRKDGTFRDVAHPLNSETRKMIEEAVLEVYEGEVESLGSAPPAADVDTAAVTEPETVAEEEAAQETPSEEEAAQETPSEEEAAQETPSEEEAVQETPSEEEDPVPPSEGEETGAEKPSEEKKDIIPEDPEKAFGYEE